jgi:hypothetical protein
VTAPQDLRNLRLILLEGFNGALSIALLPDTDAGVADENEQDDKGLDECRYLILRLLKQGKNKGKDGGEQ